MKNLCSGSQFGGFQFLMILDLWGISFHALVVFGLGKNFLLKSALGHCEEERFRDLLYCVNVPKTKQEKSIIWWITNFQLFSLFFKKNLSHEWTKYTCSYWICTIKPRTSVFFLLCDRKTMQKNSNLTIFQPVFDHPPTPSCQIS